MVGRFAIDKSWYRAEVLEVAPERGEASLFYVDFGNKEVLPFAELRAIKAAYAGTPIHGLRCAVGGIKVPPGGQWKEEDTAIYVTCLHKYLVPEGDAMQCRLLVESLADDGMVWVDLVSEKLLQSLSEDLSQQLDGARLQMPLQPQVLPAIATATATATAAATATATATAEKPPAPIDVLSLEQLLQPPVLPASAAVASTAPAALPPAAATTLEAAALCVSPESVVPCGIQEINSCQEFYVNRKEAEDALNALREKLNGFCEGGRAGGRGPEACRAASRGDLVLVQFSADREWYRGRVERLLDEGRACTVFFLDYGNSEDKAATSLKLLPQRFAALPAQAIACRLAGVPHPVSPEVEARFKSTCLQTEVGIRATGKQVDEDRYFVEVLTADNRSVTDILGIQSTRKAAQRKATPGLDSDRPPSSPASSTSDAGLPSSSDKSASPGSAGSASAVLERQLPVAVVGSVASSAVPKQRSPVVAVGSTSPAPEQQSPAVVAADPVSPTQKEQRSELLSEQPSSPAQQSPDAPPSARLTRGCLQQVVADTEVMEKIMVTHIISPHHFYAMDCDRYGQWNGCLDGGSLDDCLLT